MICSLVWFLHDRPRYRNGIRYDPIEDDEGVQPALRAAEREAETQMRGYQSHMGYGKGLWLTKQAILREKYGIEWRTPAELNPKIAFD